MDFIVTGLAAQSALASVALIGYLVVSHRKRKKRTQNMLELTSKLDQAISKAQSKFTKGFSKAEANGDCQMTGDVAEVELAVDHQPHRAVFVMFTDIGE